MHPKGKNVWISGASSGIGQALAVELAKNGANVLLSARRVDKLEETAGTCRRFGHRVGVLPFDLSDAMGVSARAKEAEESFGSIDMLVNAAGVGQRGSALATDNATARKLFEVDFWGAVLLTRAVMPGMAARGSGQVVTVTGVLGKFGAPRRSFYSAAKHGLHGWFDSLREETLASGVEITLIVPGWVRTEISQAALEEDGSSHGRMDNGQEKGITPEECAKRAMPAIIRGKTEQLVGGLECGGVYLNRIWPGLFRRILRRTGIG